MTTDKLKFLKSLTESKLLRVVLIPLIKSMGYHEIQLSHGLEEGGIDILFSEIDRFNTKVYTGMIIKRHLFTPLGPRELHHLYSQLHMVRGTSYTDPSTNSQFFLSRILVVVTQNLTPEVFELLAELEKGQGIKIQLVDADMLLSLIDRYAPEIWGNAKKSLCSEAQMKLLWEKAKKGIKCYERGKALEELMYCIFSSVEGWENTITNPRNRYREIDISIINQSQDIFWSRYHIKILAECKNWSGNRRPGNNEYVSFCDKISKQGGMCTLGFFISPSGFASTFGTSINRNFGFPIFIVRISKNQIEEMIISKERGKYLKEITIEQLHAP